MSDEASTQRSNYYIRPLKIREKTVSDFFSFKTWGVFSNQGGGAIAKFTYSLDASSYAESLNQNAPLRLRSTIENVVVGASETAGCLGYFARGCGSYLLLVLLIPWIIALPLVLGEWAGWFVFPLLLVYLIFIGRSFTKRGASTYGPSEMGAGASDGSSERE